MPLLRPTFIQSIRSLFVHAPPSDWIMHQSFTALWGFYCIIAIAGVLWGAYEVVLGDDWRSGMPGLAGTIVLSVGLAFLGRNPHCKHDVKLHSLIVMLSHAVVSYSYGMFVEGDARLHVVQNIGMSWKFVIVVLGVPRSMSYVSLIAFTGNEIGTHVLSDLLYNAATSTRTLVSPILVTMLLWWFLEMIIKRFGMLYEVLQQITIERTMSQKMLAMLTDGSITVGMDADTILTSDARFNDLMGTPMETTSLMNVLCESLEDPECERVKQQFQRAKAEPVLVSATLRRTSMGTCMIDLIIVHQDSTGAADDPQRLPGYLVGVRTILEGGTRPDAAPDIEEPAWWQHALADPEEDEAVARDNHTTVSLHDSLPSATSTGDVFTGLRSASAGEMQDALQKVITLGKKERWCLDAADVQLKPDLVLGRGGFGTVIGAVLHGMDTAAKVPKHTSAESVVQFLDSLGNELRVLRHIRHPNIVLFHGAVINPLDVEIALILERVHGQSCTAFLATCTGPKHTYRRLQIITGVCCALWYLHAQKPQIIHGDLKGSNVMIEKRSAGPHAKLLDFGLSRLMTRGVRPLGGTVRWMAPEIIQNRTARPKASADVFSLGRFMYFISTGITPLSGTSKEEIRFWTIKGDILSLDWNSGVPVCQAGIAICERCLDFSAVQRPAMSEVHVEIEKWKKLSILSL